MTARRLTDFLHSRSGGRILALVGFVAIAVAGWSGMYSAPRGLGWHVGGWQGIAANFGVILFVVTLLRLINKRFNIMRRESSLGAPLLVALLATVPWTATTLYVGSLLPVVILPVSYILFTTYGSPDSTREVFLTFAMLSATAFLTPVACYYLPVLLVGTMQMRIFRLRTLSAAILGTITPPWIAVGFGLVPLRELPVPSLDMSWLGNADVVPDIPMLASTGVVIIIGVAMICANLYKLMSYNAMTRSLNGFYTLLLMATIILAALDYYNLTLYLPLLLVLVSYQATLFFVTRPGERSCIGILALMAVLWGLFAWNLCLPRL